MIPSRPARGWATALVVTSVLAAACGDDGVGPDPDPVDLVVTTATTGIDIDAGGYLVEVEGLGTRPIGPSGTVTFEGVPGGDYVVELTGVPENCSLAGQNPRTVAAGSIPTLAGRFEITCVANRGAIEVVTSTTGSDLDPDGFTATVGQTTSNSVGVNAVVTFDLLPVGTRTVELTGVADNCAVAGENPRSVTVAFGDTVSTTFEVECVKEGFLVFDSNRTGDWEIYKMNADGSEPHQRLTFRPGDDRQPSVSPDGTKIAFARTLSDGTEHIHVMNLDGSGVVRLTYTGTYNKEPSWSPDGSKIVFSRRLSGIWDVWMMDADGSDQVNLTQNPAWDARGELSPDGTRLLFDSTRDGSGNRNVFVKDPDGTVRQLTTDGGANPVWSTDGSKITFTGLPPDPGKPDIWIMNADGTGKRNLTNRSATTDGESTWSRDGSKIAFVSGRDGNLEIYVMDPDGANQQRLTFITTGDDMFPSWGP